jgi:predicted kinase
MFGVDDLHRLPKEAYAADVSDEVYARALHAADACLHAGHSAIVDAVFGSERHRRAVERVALEAGVAFTGLWIDVPIHVAEARLLARAVDASDATPEVLARQADRPVGAMTWIRIDGDAPLERVLGAAQRAVRNPVVATHAVAD